MCKITKPYINLHVVVSYVNLHVVASCVNLHVVVSHVKYIGHYVKLPRPHKKHTGPRVNLPGPCVNLPAPGILHGGCSPVTFVPANVANVA